MIYYEYMVIDLLASSGLHIQVGRCLVMFKGENLWL
jgi:hypothetical protein